MSNDRPFVTDTFDPDEIAALEAVTVPVTAGRRTDLRTLMGAWERHVDKIQADLDRPDSDQSVWGAHDLIAAMTLRSFVHEGMDALPAGLLDRMSSALADIDERFKSYTEIDAAQWIRMADGRPALPEQWWWHRIPERGPIRRELERIARHIELNE